jgi:hypothetical protein
MMLEPILQLMVLGLVIYGFLWLVSALMKGFHSHIISFNRRDAVKRRGGMGGGGLITRLGPGRFLIQEKERGFRGKPKGSHGGGRSRPPSLDLIREAKPETCYWCGANIPPERSPHKVQDRVVIDLERLERGLVGTRTLWRIHWVRCPACRRLVSGGEQVNAPKGHIYGYGAIAYAIHHRVDGQLPTTKIAEELSFILEDDAPTDQAVRDWLRDVAGKNRELFKELLELAKEEGCLQVDESGLPMDGERWWMWVISAKAATLYLASPTRGHEAIEDALSDYHGTLVADFWRAYDRLPQPKQRCLAHLYREVTDLLLEHVKAQARLEAKLDRSRVDGQIGEGEKLGRGRPRKPMTLSQGEEEKVRSEIDGHGAVAEALYQLIHLLLRAMKEEATAKEAGERLQSLLEEHRGAMDLCPHYRRIANRLLSHLDQLFRFLEEPGIDSYSTNRAERMVKGYAELRRAVPCWRSPKSAEGHAQLLSYMATWRLAGLEPWKLSLLLARGEWRAVNQHIHQALDRPPPDQTQPLSHPATIGGVL